MTDHSLKPWMLHRILFWWPGSDTPICFKSLKEMGKERKKNYLLFLFLGDRDVGKGRNSYQSISSESFLSLSASSYAYLFSREKKLLDVPALPQLPLPTQSTGFSHLMPRPVLPLNQDSVHVSL